MNLILHLQRTKGGKEVSQAQTWMPEFSLLPPKQQVQYIKEMKVAKGWKIIAFSYPVTIYRRVEL